MKISKKLILGAVAGTLALGGAIPLATTTSNTVTAATTTNKLKLAHGAYVYNKAGKPLRTYRGSTWKTHLKKGATVKFTGAIEPAERNSKHFFLLDDDNYNQSWLPYKQIKGQYYYGIGAGGYIKASNVSQIAGKPLYTSEATVTIKDNFTNKPYAVGIGKDKTTIKNGKTFKVDRITSVSSDPEDLIEYRVSGTTNAFILTDSVKTKPRQNLKVYTKYTYISFLQTADTYDNYGSKRATSLIHSTFLPGDMYPVEELTYLWIPSENKAELFYLLKYSWEPFTLSSPANYTGNPGYGDGLVYVKADNTKYVSGSFLKPDNTPEQAQIEAKTATSADKEELQKLISQAKNIPTKMLEAATNRNYHYKYILQFAKDTIKSTTASISAVKKVVFLLDQAQNDVINKTKEQDEIDNILDGTTPYINTTPGFYTKNRK
ncbi:SLAP domain-containing protein [Lactobacillus xylocopicola]|uniref:S-layer protein C-terminal domain-containing protein n=1 Tax=Lactobacillus xylocopicola TaxID=2976676 RepID=A0ABN6SK28_9LACO|nr:SLAP domain-containing protein [Lactobacillus xylocopicola]BDR59968.1 hypothetical protein KIM322_02290 [Lactobacillus xylocopicola]